MYNVRRGLRLESLNFNDLVFYIWEELMELLVFVINDRSYLEDIMVEFTNIGISGSTIIDSVGMANILTNCEEASMFSSLELLLNKGRRNNKTVFTVLQEEQVDKAIDIINKITGGLDEPGRGIAFTIPLGRVFGGSFNKDEARK